MPKDAAKINASTSEARAACSVESSAPRAAGWRREDALERYALAHGMNMEQVRHEIERCLAAGGSIRQFFESD